MYGSIPDLNKYRLFHKKKSGLNVEEATTAVNFITQPDFNIVDWIDSVDGNEVSYFREKVTYQHVQPNLLLAGRHPLAIDKVLASKMGYKENELPILQDAKRFGDVAQVPIIGGDNSVLPQWKKLSVLTNWKAKLQDKLPITDSIITNGIRMYNFDDFIS